MQTGQLTIQLPKTEIIFLERYAKQHQMTMAELIDAYVKQLQQSENTAVWPAIDPEIEKHAGILPGDLDVKREYAAYFEAKHR